MSKTAELAHRVGRGVDAVLERRVGGFRGLAHTAKNHFIDVAGFEHRDDVRIID